MRHKPRIPLPLVLILLVSWGLMMINIDLPWWEQGSDNGAWISAAVRNFERYGAANIGFVQILNFEPVTSPDHYEYYMHHPPIIVWQTAATSALFGSHEMSFRYLAAVMTLMSTVAMYILIRRLTRNTLQALWGCALYAFTPMMLFYGRMPDHEAPALAFVLLLFAVLVNLSYRITTARLAGMAILAFLCAWTAWAVLIFIGIAGIWFLWLNPKRNWKVFIGLGAITVGALVILIGYYQAVYPETINDLLNVFVYRTSNQQLSRGSAPFTMGEFLWQNFIHIVSLFTPSLLFLSAIGWMLALRQGSHTNNKDKRGQALQPVQRAVNRRTNSMILVLLLAALGYFLIFRNATYIHNYYKIYLAPFLALTASFAMVAHLPYRGRKQRVISAAMRGFVLGGVMTGGLFFALLHQSALRPQLDEVRTLLEQATQPGDTIITNLDYGINPLAYYSSTKIEGNRSPEQMLSRLESEAITGYLYCDTRALDDETPFEIPDALTDYDVLTSETCFYFSLNDR